PRRAPRRSSHATLWPSSLHLALDDHGLDRQLRRGEPKRLARDLLADAGHLVEHLARLDLRDPVLDVALTLALAHLERLLRDRLVREDADPDLAAALHVARHRAPRGLDLPRGQLAAADRLQPELAEAHRIAPRREPGVAALELLSEFGPFRLQHGCLSFLLAGPSGLRARRLGGFLLRFAEVENLAAEDPNLHADHAVRGARLGKPVIDIGTEGMQGHAPLAVPLRPRDLGAVQAPGDLHLHALGAETHRVRDGAAHRPPELNAPLELHRDAVRDELSVEHGLADLGDVQAHVLIRRAEQIRDVRATLLDVLARLADHDTRTRRMNRDVRALRRPLD